MLQQNGSLCEPGCDAAMTSQGEQRPGTPRITSSGAPSTSLPGVSRSLTRLVGLCSADRRHGGPKERLLPPPRRRPCPAGCRGCRLPRLPGGTLCGGGRSCRRLLPPFQYLFKRNYYIWGALASTCRRSRSHVHYTLDGCGREKVPQLLFAGH